MRRMPRRAMWVPWQGRLRAWRVVASLVVVVTLWGVTTLEAQPVSFTAVGSIPGPIDLVEASGTTVYAARGETLTLYDITDLEKPVRRGAHTFPEKIWGLTVRDSTVYVAAGHSGLFILDVSDPERPLLRGAVTTPGQAKNVAVSGLRAVVADHMSGIDVIDLSDEAQPVSLGSVFTDGYARDVATFGRFAYGVDNPSGFYVLDLEQPEPLEPAGMIQTAPAPRFIEMLEAVPGVAVLVGGVPYDPLRALRSQSASTVPASALHLYDVSDPATLEPLASFPTPGGARGVVLHGQLAYVADGDAGLTVVDLSTPSEPQLMGTFQTERTARDVAVADTGVLVLIGTIVRGAHTQDDGDVLLLRSSR